MPLKSYKICVFRQVIGLKNYLAIEKVNIASASMTSGVFVLFGDKKMPMMWRSWIITKH